jgi:hypothetical protein
MIRNITINDKENMRKIHESRIRARKNKRDQEKRIKQYNYMGGYLKTQSMKNQYHPPTSS